ncbi:MAG: transcription-repair coupling factor, partial [Thermoanaerobaculia bacterium]|nr:transcription-repair coupling factor [Thermoanaerobaculia bacterium]
MRNESLFASLRSRLADSGVLRELIGETDRTRGVTGLSLEARALVLSTLQEIAGNKIAIIVPGDASTEDFATALRLFHPKPERVAVYPSPSLSPYQNVSTSLAILQEEIQALGQLAVGNATTIVIPGRALFRRLPDLERFRERILTIRKDEEVDPHEILDHLIAEGYVRTDLVGEIGELAFRGGIIDLFPPNEDRPVRLELFGDVVDSIRHFDVDTQRSDDELREIAILPSVHFPETRATRKQLARKLSLDFGDPHYRHDLSKKIDLLNEGGTYPGIDDELSLVADSDSFLGYLSDGWEIVRFEPGEIEASIEKFTDLLESEFEHAREQGRAVYPPDQLLVSYEEVSRIIGRSKLDFEQVHVLGEGRTETRIRSTPEPSWLNRLGELTSELRERIEDGVSPVYVFSTHGGKEKIVRLIDEFSLPHSEDPEEPGPYLTVTRGSLPHGFELPAARLRILSEWDLFERPTSRGDQRRRSRTGAFVSDLRDLKTGDLVVHIDHGVAKFAGLERVEFGPSEREVMVLEYSGGGRLLVPMESLNLIQKYSGAGDSSARLDRLGGTGWAKTKASVKRAMRDMADELLKLYARRSMVDGHAFSPDSQWQKEFESAFEFEETPDQAAAIDEIKADMESRKTMDRLLCGDVGYGKTEVAMRAAFKAVMDGKQVAVLAPTTVLAYQHYRTFLRRFASFPIVIELTSRLWTSKEQRKIIERTGSGEIDILIGTHRLLSKAVEFRDLGLLVIDEEQRFGVAQKERLKKLKQSVDVVSMSATPIPRTLNMSMMGIRDISVIETPPKDRLAIQTAVVGFDDDFIREAIEFEVERGGQVFFVHNRVESIYAMRDYLEKLMPDLRVAVGHGQMNERELENTMMAFIGREYDLLLATTIIENGIDIPACNTILINHAERFGLSQLYQLRGRVGRSDRLAFCYLLVPSQQALSDDARKRLAAIQEFADLGAGFRIAARDLEIRGAGNLLGGEQSGHIAAVGFEMYMKLLDETIAELKGEPLEAETDTTLNLGLDIYIPDQYIDDENLRMTFYKRIASAAEPERLDDLKREMKDRFGSIPETVETLYQYVELKQIGRSIGISSIHRKGDTVSIRFNPDA